MAWSDEPTEAQLGAVARLIQWKVDNVTLALALKFLEENATRKEIFTEVSRLRELYATHRLTEDNVFDSPIWEGFRNE